MLHKLPKYLVWIGAFLFVAMFPVGELCAQNNLETLTNKDLFAYPPKSSLRATRWLHKADKFKAEGNVEKAVLYYTKAAEKGDARAQFVLSLCYNEGYGVSPDAERSMHWLSLSVKQEYALAQNFLGVVYTYHKENADYKKALDYYKKAALQGYSEAQYNVGWCYFNGYGVEADQEEAMRWIRKAAEQEYALALDAMWQGYYFGAKGLPRDYKQAADCDGKSDSQGRADATTLSGNVISRRQGSRSRYGKGGCRSLRDRRRRDICGRKTSWVAFMRWASVCPPTVPLLMPGIKRRPNKVLMVRKIIWVAVIL